MGHPTIACTLGSAELAERIATLERELFAAATSSELIEGGVRHTFASTDAIKGELFAFIEAEATCCSFLTFRLTVSPEQGPIELEITGPELSQDLIRETFLPADHQAVAIRPDVG